MLHDHNVSVHLVSPRYTMVGGGEEVRWLVTASGRGWGLRGCRQDGGGQGSCSHHPGSDFAVGGPACSVLCSHVRSLGEEGGRRGEEGGPVGRTGRGRAPGCAAGWRAVGALCIEADARKGRRGRGEKSAKLQG